MIHRCRTLCPVLAAVILLAAAPGVPGAELTFTASVDRTKVGLDDPLTLTVSVSGRDIGGLSEPELPSLNRLEIIGTNTSSSSQFSFVNGKMTSSKTYDFIYTLRPVEVGKASIGPATLKFKGETYRTEPIEIEVVAGTVSGKPPAGTSPGSAAPAPPATPEVQVGEDLFLRAHFDRTKVYVGQQVTVTYSLYNRTTLANVQYGALPPFTGFWVEEMYNADRLNFQQQVIEGKRYQVAVLKKLALFPTTAGQIQVEPMELLCDIRVRSRDIFDSFWGRTKRAKIASQPMTISVQALPQEEKPAGFSGAVGRFSLTAKLDQGQVKAGEPLQLTLEISGQGNMKTISPPALPILDNFTSFEPEVVEKPSTQGDRIGGTKTYRYVLIPKEEGQYQIQAFHLDYFDPQEQGYRMTSTKPLDIRVLAGEPSDLPLAVGLGREEIKILGKDIRYIKPNTAVLKDQGDDLLHNRAFLALQVVPLMAIAVAAVARKRRDRISHDIGYARWRRAHRTARRGLKAAHGTLKSGSTAQFCSAVHKTMCEYLGDKLNISASGITSQQLQERLERMDVPNDLVQEVLVCLQTCDYSRFAPDSAQFAGREELLERVRNVIRRLEKSGLQNRSWDVTK